MAIKGDVKFISGVSLYSSAKAASVSSWGDKLIYKVEVKEVYKAKEVILPHTPKAKKKKAK